jgi:hypothetical protein
MRAICYTSVICSIRINKRLFVGDQALYLSYVGLVGDSGLSETSLALSVLLVQDMALKGMSADNLTVLGEFEAFLRSAVSFDLRHINNPPLVYVVTWWASVQGT